MCCLGVEKGEENSQGYGRKEDLKPKPKTGEREKKSAETKTPL